MAIKKGTKVLLDLEPEQVETLLELQQKSGARDITQLVRDIAIPELCSQHGVVWPKTTRKRGGYRGKKLDNS